MASLVQAPEMAFVPLFIFSLFPLFLLLIDYLPLHSLFDVHKLGLG
jgi:hypothetical protein